MYWGTEKILWIITIGLFISTMIIAAIICMKYPNLHIMWDK